MLNSQNRDRWPVANFEWVMANGSYLLPGRPAHAHEVHKEEADDAV